MDAGRYAPVGQSSVYQSSVDRGLSDWGLIDRIVLVTPVAARRAPAAMMEGMPRSDHFHFMYVLRCADGSLYTGYTIDMERRLAQHQAGKASRYTRARRPVSLVGWWQFEDKVSAMQAEAAFKRLTRREKLQLVQDAEACG